MVAIEARRGEGTGQHGGASSAVEASNARESTQTLLAVIILICGGVDDGEKCRRPPVPSLDNYRWWLATTFDKAFVLLPPDSASLANVQWRFHSLEWVVERFFPCFISIYHPEERGAGMIERLDPSWIDWKRANGKGFRNDSSLMIDERRR